ncbi:MAG: Coenzyme F420 hydrogenase/dehydrogenase, beta subunit C-terminal domain [Desulfobacteraceae bacterium]|nr:Coenzyme F420 hydrogenase/dehydrogenase, beta subunit C-terminal domain [Desulfobacteraceae bacterium]
MKTFFHLIEEIQKPGLCQQCGGCVTFCTAINYGALELDEDGKPRYKDIEKCVECGLCYSICPETHELDEEIKWLFSWQAPMGRVLDATVARAMDVPVRKQGTDGGVVTALLLHLFEKGQIDGAIVTKKIGSFQRVPWLASSREEIMEAAGFHFDTSHGLELFSERYSTYSAFSPSLLEVGRMGTKRLNQVAFVGTPCQVNTIRRIQALGIDPSHSIKIVFGLFCTGNFIFNHEHRLRIEKMGGFQWNEVTKINVKEHLLIHLHNGQVRSIPLDQLDFMKRHACRYCSDYTSEFADLSFGGLGSPEDWTTVVARTPLGQSVLNKALGRAIEAFPHKEAPDIGAAALAKAMQWSEKKKQSVANNRSRKQYQPVMA